MEDVDGTDRGAVEDVEDDSGVYAGAGGGMSREELELGIADEDGIADANNLEPIEGRGSGAQGGRVGSATGARGGSGAPTMEVGLSRGSREGYDEQGGEGGQCPGSRARRGESRPENRGSWALGGRRVGDAEQGRRMPGAVLVRRPHGDEGSPWEEEWRRRKRGRKIREMIRRNRIREIQDPSAR